MLIWTEFPDQTENLMAVNYILAGNEKISAQMPKTAAVSANKAANEASSVCTWRGQVLGGNNFLKRQTCYLCIASQVMELACSFCSFITQQHTK